MTPDIEITDLSRVTISCVCWVFCFKVNIAKDINTSFPNNLQISQNHVKNKNESPRIGRKGKRKFDSGQGTSTAKKSKR